MDLYRKGLPLMSTEQPRVLISRAPDTLGDLQVRLAASGIRVEGVALIETRPCPADLPPDAAYDWALFTSVNGVRYFFERFGSWWRSLPSPPRVAAVGPVTARALEERGISVDLLPHAFDGVTTAETLLAQGLDRHSRLLWPGGNLANPEVKALLARVGVPYAALAVYRTDTRLAARDELTALLAPPPEVLAFTSPSSVRAFEELAGLSAARACAIAAIGPSTARAALERFGRAEIQADAYTLEGLASAVERYLMATDP